MHARGLAVLFAVCLVGCTAQVEDEGCEDMSGRQPLDDQNRIEHWGVTHTYGAPWRENQERPVIFKPPFKALVADARGHKSRVYCVPQVQSMLLTAAIDPGVGNYAFRWALNIGGGGGSARVLFDMLNTQQIAIAAENLKLSMLIEKGNPLTQFSDPGNVNVSLSASFADGNVAGSTATYSQVFTVLAHSDSPFIPIPQMATQFRITGADGDTKSPFVAGVAMVFGVSAGTNEIYLGNKLTQYNDQFMPLNGNARQLQITNTTANDVDVGVVWGLDL